VAPSGAGTEPREGTLAMHVAPLGWSAGHGWRGPGLPAGCRADLVIYFGGTETLRDGARHHELCAAHPGAAVVGCSTGGQIADGAVVDEGVQALRLSFQATRVALVSDRVGGAAGSLDCGHRLGDRLAAPDLAGVLLFGDGLDIHAGDLIAGMQDRIGAGVPIVGALAGDGPRFAETLVGAGAMAPATGQVAAIGLCGSAIRFGHGCAAGWDAFGPLRSVTASSGNVLQALDGEPALKLYERYLGPEAEGLPHTGLLYPLRIWNEEEPGHDLLRTVLGIDREAGTLTFAADVPAGWRAQLMRGRFDALVQAAGDAAAQASRGLEACHGQRAAIIVSCIGRRLLTRQRITEEVAAAAARLGSDTPMLGIYSYGEIAPHPVSGRSELHNQTMTVAMLGEVLEA
jgi:hypothetical protein